VSAAGNPAAELVGPVQVIVVGFGDDRFTGDILPELARLREQDVIRLIDLLFVRKDAGGNLEVLEHSDLGRDELMDFGALVGALVGLGAGDEDTAERMAIAGAAELEDGRLFDDDDVWYLSDAVPPGTAAAIALIEHRWAIPLRERIRAAGGVALADEWIHPEDLVAVGVDVAAASRAGDGA
jgi:uncharacterized membrane protein